MALRTEERPIARQPAATGEAIVEARSIDKRYDTGELQVHALRSVSLAVRSGEMVAIMGPSGSGKTTLLNCLSGLDRIDGGEVLIEGVGLAGMSDDERTDYRARRMGFVFQFYNLMPILSAVENVELPLLVARVHAKEARRKALAALEMVGLGERAQHLPDELSGGQRQRATIARALVNDPAIVWADEPTGDLDSENAAEIVSADAATQPRARGLTFLIVTHDISVGRATDRIVRMVDGEIVGEEHSPGGAVMVARVTLAEVDAVRMSIDSALEIYRTSVMPALHAQDGYEGCYVLTTPEGKATGRHVLERRGSPPMPASRVATTPSRCSKFVTFFRSPPAARPTRSASPTRRCPCRAGRPTMTKLFGLPVGSVLVVLVAAARHHARRPRRPRARNRVLLPPRRAQCPSSSGAHRTDRGRLDARHDDHRSRARDGRHHEPDDPLVGGRRARPRRRRRGGSRRRCAPLAAEHGRDRRALLPAVLRRSHRSSGRTIRPRRRGRPCDRRADRRAGRDVAPERAARHAVCEHPAARCTRSGRMQSGLEDGLTG